MAIVFMMTSLTLGYFAGRRPSATIFDQRTPATEPRTVPQSSVPANPPGGATEGSAAPAAPAGGQPQANPAP
jgi:hypothetical protein